ncbi:MAG: hypothetical protein ACK45B_01145 [Limisphaerales bacterium]
MQPTPAPTPDFWDWLIGIALVVTLVGGLGWMFWRALRRSDDPPRLLFKWIMTAVALAILIRVVVPMVQQGGYEGAFVGIPAAAVMGLVLALIWRHNLTMLIAKPFASLYDGGDLEAEPKPQYSAAQARRQRGDFHGARAEVREQLRQFPHDFEGHMLLAEIEALNFKDLPAAEVAIARATALPNLPAPNIALAWNALADWHLQVTQDLDGARAALTRIVERLPESEWALRAQQRIAHLPSRAQLDQRNERRTFKVAPIEGDPGLERGRVTAPPEVDPDRQAAQWVKHLEEFPHDNEIREKLARLYLEHYHRLDLAMDQLEQLIQFPNQPTRDVVRWLNLLADFQVKGGADYDTVRGTLQRIIDLDPEAGAAQVAQNRIERLRLELRGQQSVAAIKLGTYEDDLGLKRGGTAVR